VNATSGKLADLTALSEWAPELAKTFVSLASDIALVIDGDGVIRNVAQGSADPIAPGAYQWVGRAWIDTVSGDTRPKIENLLKEVASTGVGRRREVNHPLSTDNSIPVAYTAIRLGANGPVLAVGRDMRTIAAIQQRYVESQQELERGYWQARQAEARYQLLFQVATDAVIVIDGETFRIIEANQAAAQMLGAPADQLPGRQASAGFEHYSRAAVNELLANARATGQSGEIRARLQGSVASASVVATSFRADDTMRLLMRVRTLPDADATSGLNKTLARLVEGTSDAVVVTDSSARIQVANPAFLALADLNSDAALAGQPLMRWLTLAGQPLAALVAKVRRDGIARHVECWIRHGTSQPAAVEISAALLTEGDQECIGFTIRPVADAGATQPSAEVDRLALALRAGIEAVSAQLGERDLAAMVHEVSELAERHFIGLALQRSGGDVTKAARLLGLSPEILSTRVRLDACAPADPDASAS
jgi:transcriptional regulator PpsR